MKAATSVNAWSLGNGKGYMLNNNDRVHAAACRLNLQFYLWKESLKFNIHPSIRHSLPKTAMIADVAAGTGIWLIDVSRDFPKATLNGFDYNLAQAPHAQWLPSNMKLHHWNIFDEVPPEHVGKYDLVHTRLLVLVVESEDPRPILRNLCKLLKPGGYLQWDELDAVNVNVRKLNPDIPTPALEKLRDWQLANGRYDWTSRLPEYFAKEGLQTVEVERYPDPPEFVRAFNETNLLTVEEFAEGAMRNGNREAALGYFESIKQAHQECLHGAALCLPRLVCIGQKPF